MEFNNKLIFWTSLIILVGALFIFYISLKKIEVQKENSSEKLQQINSNTKINENIVDNESFVQESIALNSSQKVLSESQEKSQQIVRQPQTLEQMQAFVRPDEEKEELEKMYIGKDKTPQEAIDTIFNRFYMPYLEDVTLFGTSEYWQTPKERISNKGGDCEDWAISFLSLLREYNSSLNCYDAIWFTHVSVICRIDRKFLIYDQGKTSGSHIIEENKNEDSAISQQNIYEMRAWLNRYFNNYGLPPNERTLLALINDKEIISFESTENFVSWAVSFEK